MEQEKGNPQNPADNAPSDNNEAQSQVFGSSNEFFSQLESEVNGAIDDSKLDAFAPPPKNEPGNESPVTAGPNQATPQTYQGNSNSIDWEKRYKDSSKEAQKLARKVKDFTSFEPLLNVMRKDQGLVTHIKDYLQSGGKPNKSVKEELGLDDDFRYDAHEAVDNPESDSAKLFNKTLDKAVDAKVGSVVKKQQMQTKQAMAQKAIAKKAVEFQKEHQVSNQEMQAVLKNAAAKKLSIEDSYFLLNRNKAGRNMANSVRKDVMNQMETARNIPNSASHANSARVEKNPTDDVFDTLLGSDEADNLFG